MVCTDECYKTLYENSICKGMEYVQEKLEEKFLEMIREKD